MALREAGADGFLQWDDEAVPMLQLSRIDLHLDGGVTAKIVTYQNGDRWGLSRRDDLPPLSQCSRDEASIFRTREFRELPMGTIVGVLVMTDEREDISEVRLSIAGHDVRMCAGEVYENNDGTLTITRMDESILLQVDARKPVWPQGPSADGDHSRRVPRDYPDTSGRAK